MERHFEELRLELRCGDSRPSPEQKEGLEQEENGQKNDAEWWEKGRAEQESDDGDLEEEKRRQGKAGFQDGEFSQRVHELYRDFLRVVTANLEGTTLQVRTLAYEPEDKRSNYIEYAD